MKEELISLLVGTALGVGMIWYFKSRVVETSTTQNIKSVAMGVRG